MSELQQKISKLLQEQQPVTESEAQDLAALICDLPEIKGGRIMDEEKTEYELLKGQWGNAIKYVDKDCPHCGRHRVELFKNGKEVCEKCSYNTNGKFESEHWTLYH
jgi:ribosomal protein L37E